MGSPQCRGTWTSPSRVTWNSVPHSAHTKNTSRSATSSGSTRSFGTPEEMPRRNVKPTSPIERNRPTATAHSTQSAMASIPEESVPAPGLSEAFDDRGVRHAAALAHRLEAEAAAPAVELVPHGGQQ